MNDLIIMVIKKRKWIELLGEDWVRPREFPYYVEGKWENGNCSDWPHLMLLRALGCAL